jgi:hypothetical protein
VSLHRTLLAVNLTATIRSNKKNTKPFHRHEGRNKNSTKWIVNHKGVKKYNRKAPWFVSLHAQFRFSSDAAALP